MFQSISGFRVEGRVRGLGVWGLGFRWMAARPWGGGGGVGGVQGFDFRPRVIAGFLLRSYFVLLLLLP